MPAYKQVTIGLETENLNGLVTQAEKLAQELNARNISENEKQQKRNALNLLVNQIGPQFDRVLDAADVAESNNQAYCKYMQTVHAKAKADLANLKNAVTQLENNWDPEIVKGFEQLALAIPRWQLALKTDDEQFQSAKIAFYRANDWSKACERAVALVPNKQPALQQRINARQAGIMLSTTCKALKVRLEEYAQRLEALRKTVEMIKQRRLLIEQNSSKLLKEANEFVETSVKTVKELCGNLQVKPGGAIEEAKRIKKFDQKAYKNLLALEPKVAADLKAVRGKKKTLEAQRDQLLIRVKEAKIDFSAGEKKIAEQLGILKKELETTASNLALFDKYLKEGKNKKW